MAEGGEAAKQFTICQEMKMQNLLAQSFKNPFYLLTLSMPTEWFVLSHDGKAGVPLVIGSRF